MANVTYYPTGFFACLYLVSNTIHGIWSSLHSYLFDGFRSPIESLVRLVVRELIRTPGKDFFICVVNRVERIEKLFTIVGIKPTDSGAAIPIPVDLE